MLISLYLRNKGSLHGLTLPKSWLVRLLQDADQLATMRSDKSGKYIARMSQLLRSVCTGDNACESPEPSFEPGIVNNNRRL